MSEPRTAAGKALLDRLPRAIDGTDVGQFGKAILAIELEASQPVLREAASALRGWPWEEWRGRVPDAVLRDAANLADALHPGDGASIRAALAHPTSSPEDRR